MLRRVHAKEGLTEFLHFDEDLIDQGNTSLAKSFRIIESDSALNNIKLSLREIMFLNRFLIKLTKL